MDSQEQGYPSRGRQATTFLQREGARTSGPSTLPAEQHDSDFLKPLEWRYKPPLARKKAVYNFRVRWPALVPRDQETQVEDLPYFGVYSLDRRPHGTNSYSSGASISLKHQENRNSELQDSQSFAACFPKSLAGAPHTTILNKFLKPESMTWLEKKVRWKMQVAMSQVEKEREAVKLRRAVLLKDTRELQEAQAWEEAANKSFLERLKKAGEERQSKYDSLWKDYIQQCQEIEDKRRELLSSFTSRTATLGMQLVQGRRLEAGLRRKLRALRPVAQVRKRQDREKAALEREEASVVADIPLMDRDRHWHFLKERAALEKRVEELSLLESGEDITRELRRTAKALEAAAKQAHKDFCQGINAEGRRLQTQLHHLDEEFCQLEARREKLEQRKQQGKEQQWYLEALARGRQRLLQREHGRPKPQAAPHPTQGRPLSARPKANPK
ncbi:coiled-coil domain-containing protein 121-like [Acomys russatus]|uniref:coiled-coil domain-containing protein 121-like n=1 Tax=Acomys russatus TaxID=60746 RepID=UPI0021E2FE40|nr:coiled-coil domain-containing protein 121-like [Acomys russatus]